MDMDGIRKLAMEHRDLELFERTRPRAEARYNKALRALTKFLRTPEHPLDDDVIDAIAMALDALTSEYFDKVERNGDKCRMMFAELDTYAEDEN